MTSKKAIFVYSKELEEYTYPSNHPFNTTRAKKVRDILNSMGMLSGDGRSEVPPESASRVVLKKFHSARYLHALKNAAKGKWDVEALEMGIGTGDCPVFPGLYDYSVLATGATLTGAEMISSSAADIAFNPSGGYHHAHPEKAAGFCYINDVALACMHFADEGKRVLYLDIDVHHGDGVAYAFYDRSDVMTISFHQNPRTLFPGTGFVDEIGSGDGLGYCVNVPLPIGTYDQIYQETFVEIAMPLIKAYKPDVFVFELGADALANDPLANLYLTNNTYVEVIKNILTLDKPILMTGGGGYNVENTVRAWALAWNVLCGEGSGDYMNLGLGGVMLETTDWQGGLRDRDVAVTAQQRNAVDPAIKEVKQKIKETIFPIHGL